MNNILQFVLLLNCPVISRLATKQDIDLYENVIVDFKYFKISDGFEEKLRSNGKSVRLFWGSFCICPWLIYYVFDFSL